MACLGRLGVSGPEKGYAGGGFRRGARARRRRTARRRARITRITSNHWRITRPVEDPAPWRRGVPRGVSSCTARGRPERRTRWGGGKPRGTRVEKRTRLGFESRCGFSKAVFSASRLVDVSGEAFAKRASAAFRAALGRLVIAEVDAWMDREGMASVDASGVRGRASPATFARAAPRRGGRRWTTARGPRRRLPFFPMTTRARGERAKAASRTGGGRRVCERCARWMSTRSSSTRRRAPTRWARGARPRRARARVGRRRGRTRGSRGCRTSDR